MASTRPTLKTAFRKSRVIAPVHTGGPIALAHDGAWLIGCIGEDRDQIILYEIESGVEICKFKGDTTSVTSLASSPSSTHLTVFFTTLALRTYELPSSSESSTSPVPPIRATSKAHDAPVHVSLIDPSSTLLASGSADGVVKVWDIMRGYITHMFKGHGGIVSSLAFNHPRETSGSSSSSSSQLQLVTGSADTRLRIFDLTSTQSRSASAKASAVLEGHVSVPRGLSMSADGRYLISGGRDSVVLIWDLGVIPSKSNNSSDKGKEKQKFNPKLVKTIPVLERVEALGVLSDASAEKLGSGETRLLFYTAGSKGIVRVWDAWEGQVVSSFGEETIQTSSDDEAQRGILDASYIRSSSTIVSVHADQNIFFHSLTTGTLSRQLIGFNDEIIDAVLLSPTPAQPDSHLALATNSSLIRLYSTSNFDARLLSGHTDMVLCIDRGASGRLLASGSKDRSLRLWASSSDQGGAWSTVAIGEGHAESVGAVAISRQGPGAKFLFSGSQDRTVKMWDLSNVPLTMSSSSPSSPTRLRSLTTHKAHDKDINSLDVAPNDRLLATGSQDKTAKIFEIEYVVTSAGPRGEIKLVGTCKGHKRGVWSVKFSKTERYLATGSGDKSVKMWSLDDFSCLKTFEGHTNSVLRVEFFNQGSQLVTSASDGLVKLWNVRDEECVTTMDNHEDKVWALAVTADESTIISGAADSVVTFWADCTEQEQEEKESKRAELVLKEQDFQNYLSLQDYRNAILLALVMDQPGRLFTVFRNIRSSRSVAHPSPLLPSLTGHPAVDSVIETLSLPQLARLLTYVRDWNATSRTSTVAQTVLHAILKLRSAEDIVDAFQAKGEIEFDGLKPSSKGAISLKDLVDAMIPYTERHFTRMDTMVQDSYIVDFLLGEMDSGLFLEV